MTAPYRREVQTKEEPSSTIEVYTKEGKKTTTILFNRNKTTFMFITLIAIILCSNIMGVLFERHKLDDLSITSTSFPTNFSQGEEQSNALGTSAQKGILYKTSKTCVITIAPMNDFGSVWNLYDSIVKSSPSIPCFIWFMSDDANTNNTLVQSGRKEIREIIDNKDRFSKFQLVTLTEIEDSRENFHAGSLAFMFNMNELQSTLKPFAFQYAFQSLKADAVIYLDSDIWVTSSLEGVQQHLSHNSAVVTPHYSTPIPEDGKKLNDKDILAKGVFNFGFVAFSNTSSSANFLNWWGERLILYGFAKTKKSMFNDQNWGMFIPAFFKNNDYYVIHDSRYNVGYWNLHERGAGLHMKKDEFPYLKNVETGEDERVVFMHFAGLSKIEKHDIEGLSKDQNRFSAKDFPRLSAVYETYIRLLEQHNVVSFRMLPYGFSQFTDGRKVEQWMRELYAAAMYPVPNHGFENDPDPPYDISLSPYLRLWFRDNVSYDNPFCASDDCHYGSKKTAFSDWMEDVAPGFAVDLNGAFYKSTMENMAWDKRHDVKQAFPDPYGSDMLNLRRWFNSTALQEDTVDKSSFELWKGTIKHHIESHEKYHKVITSKSDKEVGLNIIGWHAGQFSIGISGAKIVRAAISENISVNAIELEMTQQHKFVRPEYLGFELTRSIYHPINLVVVNADMYPPNDIPPVIWQNKYNIGYWAWELDIFKPEWIKILDKVDEVWCPSAFIKASIESSPGFKSKKTPIKVLPIPLEPKQEKFNIEKYIENRSERLYEIFAQNENSKPFVFLTAFDFHSFKERKNPEGVLRAFVEAFPLEKDERHTTYQYQLIVKTIYGTGTDIHKLKEVANHDPRVIFLNEMLSDADNKALYKHQDCFVSLHRSEGYGMIILENLGNGIPVIATNYSGNVDFFSAIPEFEYNCTFPVPYNLIELKDSYGPYTAGNHWAYPNHDKAVEYMRAVVKNDCKNLHGEKIAAGVKKKFGYKAIGQQIKRMIKESIPAAYEKQEKVRQIFGY